MCVCVCMARGKGLCVQCFLFSCVCMQSCAQLQHESRDISPLCVSVPNPADVTIFTAGCEDGGLYVCAISGRSVAPTAAIRAHNGEWCVLSG